ncbi:hypothetical protein scyTo_0001523 [Scyliorhinus torazame]|uniref:Uncharacterized protein n=1 Tax=Scyliorhinus torazame TaxID=75743 RepID=A0A401PDY2_SCYTO|nr:hypothetical protein [Scyliorhinus torazame]
MIYYIVVIGGEFDPPPQDLVILDLAPLRIVKHKGYRSLLDDEGKPPTSEVVPPVPHGFHDGLGFFFDQGVSNFRGGEVEFLGGLEKAVEAGVVVLLIMAADGYIVQVRKRGPQPVLVHHSVHSSLEYRNPVCDAKGDLEEMEKAAFCLKRRVVAVLQADWELVICRLQIY